MKRFLAISLVILALSLSLNAQEHTKRPPVSTPRATPTQPPRQPATVDAEGWVRFNSALGRFSVMMPKIPEDNVSTVPSDHGPYTTYLFVVRDTPNVYLVGWVDYDPSFNFNRQSELEANRDNFVKGVNATLTGSRTMTIDNYPVLEFTAETVDRAFKSRVYMVGRRPYQIVIGFPKGESEIAPISKFFDSFKVSR